MFCDLVGSTELSSQLDPEDMREVLKNYQDVVAGMVTRHGGFVANYLGDGVLTYFGWPVAHDEQAVQAVYAALAAVGAVANIVTPHGKPIQARVGIATGEVVVGDLDGQISKQASAIAGETPNLASRLEGLAGPGGVVVGDLTRRLLGDHFELVDHGRHSLKGISGSVQAWLIEGARGTESRFEARGSKTLGIVGREHEVGLLEARWQNARAGEGQVVLVSGEAGIGKSHLIHALVERIKDSDPIVLRYQCSSYHTQTAYYPIIQHIERAAGFAMQDGTDARLDKLASLLGPVEDPVRLMANLLLIPFENRYGTIDLPPEERKKRTSDALIDQVLKLTTQQPVLVLFEDAHWLDRASQELLGELITRITDTPLLLLVTHRPEWSPSWGNHSNVNMLHLSRFGRRESKAIIERIAGHRIAEETVTQIVQRADGVPLFIEELTKSLVEHDLDAGGSNIPNTLQASLFARLDRLGADLKEIVQVGSVLGREFQHRLISELADRSEDLLIQALEQLLQSGLILRRGSPPDATYSFRHALVQDAVYASTLRNKRQSLHLAVAEALTGSQSELGLRQPELVAYHYEEGGFIEQAIKYRVIAGDQSTAQSAGDEAALHYNTALRLLSKVELAHRPKVELETNLKLANASMLIGGYASQEAYDAWERARTLATEQKDTENYLRAALGMVPTMLAKGQFASALNLFKDYAPDHASTLNHINQVHYNTCLGVAYACIGYLDSAKPFIDEGLTVNGRNSCTPRNPWAGADPEIALRSYDTMVKHMQLEPSAATTSADIALSAAQRFDDPFGSVWSQVIKLRTLVWRGRYDEAVEYANLAEQEAIKHGFQQRVGNIVSLRGIANIGRGFVDVGVEEVNRGLEIWFKRGGLFHLAQWYVEAASVAVRAKSLDAVREFVKRAQIFEAKMELPTAEAELRRLRGVLAEDDGDIKTASSSIKHAIDLARSKGGHLTELRAALDAVRLKLILGEAIQPLELVRSKVNGLDPGDDMPEVVEARRVLAS